MAFYRLPGFIGETLSSQPKPPRRIPIQSIVLAVLDGADCAIYAGGAVVFVAFGLTFMTGSFGVTPAPIWDSSTFVGVGLILVLLVAFRVWQVGGAMRNGQAHIAQVTVAQAGPARLTGTPWGEPLVGRAGPIAARGGYRFTDTGETGHYYMQQTWALTLRQGMRIWVVRVNGRDVLYAPVVS